MHKTINYYKGKYNFIMVNVIKFRTLVACQKGQANSTDPDQTTSEAV